MLQPPHVSLGAELAREQDRVHGDRRISELELMRGGGRARLRAAHRYRQIATILLGVFVVVTAFTAYIAFEFPVVHCAIDGEGALKDGGEVGFGRWVVASAQEPKQVAFSDGSLAKLAAGSRIRVIGTNRRGASVTLESGSTELRVAGSRFAEYLVGVGPFSLAITKGWVELSWDPMNELLDLVVHEGYVVISGCQFGPGRSVMAGKELGTRCISR
jgi:hypothetical protein